MLNLDEIKPSTEFRRDADVQSDVVGVLNANPLPNLTITGIEKGLRNIFRGYRVDQIESTYDIHPLHAFAVTGELEYYLTEQCN